MLPTIHWRIYAALGVDELMYLFKRYVKYDQLRIGFAAYIYIYIIYIYKSLYI